MAATACALALHAWLAWGLNELLGGNRRTTPTVAPDGALQVVWLAPREMAPAPLAAPVPSVRLEAVAMERPRTRSRDVPAESAPEPEPEPVPVPPSSPTTEVLVGQVRHWAQQQAPLEFAGADPLADRIAVIPGRRADRFRMTTAPSVADVVGMIAGMIGGGPGPDPCMSNRDDIAALASGRDPKALDLAVDFDRRHCRP